MIDISWISFINIEIFGMITHILEIYLGLQPNHISPYQTEEAVAEFRSRIYINSWKFKKKITK